MAFCNRSWHGSDPPPPCNARILRANRTAAPPKEVIGLGVGGADDADRVMGLGGSGAGLSEATSWEPTMHTDPTMTSHLTFWRPNSIKFFGEVSKPERHIFLPTPSSSSPVLSVGACCCTNQVRWAD